MALSREDSIRLYGTERYTAWGEAEAAADAKALGITNPMNTGVFDFAAEAEKAYGELGTYYDRLLKEANYDVDKAVTRLTTDYDLGVRRAQQDKAVKDRALEISVEQENQGLMKSGLERGVTRRSAYDAGPTTSDALGIFGLQQRQLGEQQGARQQTSDTAYDRYLQDALTSKSRTEEDLKLQSERYSKNLDEQRKREATDIANSRGNRFYSLYNAQLM